VAPLQHAVEGTRALDEALAVGGRDQQLDQLVDDRVLDVEVWVHDNRPGCEVEVHHGGQPLYPYLFGIE